MIMDGFLQTISNQQMNEMDADKIIVFMKQMFAKIRNIMSRNNTIRLKKQSIKNKKKELNSSYSYSYGRATISLSIL